MSTCDSLLLRVNKKNKKSTIFFLHYNVPITFPAHPWKPDRNHHIVKSKVIFNVPTLPFLPEYGIFTGKPPKACSIWLVRVDDIHDQPHLLKHLATDFKLKIDIIVICPFQQSFQQMSMIPKIYITENPEQPQWL